MVVVKNNRAVTVLRPSEADFSRRAPNSVLRHANQNYDNFNFITRINITSWLTLGYFLQRIVFLHKNLISIKKSKYQESETLS